MEINSLSEIVTGDGEKEKTQKIQRYRNTGQRGRWKRIKR